MSAVPREIESEHLPSHVALCAERYAGLFARLKRVERILWLAATGVIGLQTGIILLLLRIVAKI